LGSGGVVGLKPPQRGFLKVCDPWWRSLGKLFSENVKYTFFRKTNFIFDVFQEFSKFVFFQPIISSSKTPEIRHF